MVGRDKGAACNNSARKVVGGADTGELGCVAGVVWHSTAKVTWST